MSSIDTIQVGGSNYDLEATALASESGIDGVAFDGGNSIVHYGACATAAATAAKICSLGNDFVLGAGARVSVKFSYANTAANPTLSVNGSDAKAIMAYGTTPAGSGAWAAGETISFEYDGTYWQMVNGGIASTSVYGRVMLDAAPTNGSMNAPTSDGVYDALALKADGTTEAETRAMIAAEKTVSAQYEPGDYFIYNGVLYKATTTISAGGAVQPGTNCVKVVIGSKLNSYDITVGGNTLDIAAILNGIATEETFTASKAYTAGDYLLKADYVPISETNVVKNVYKLCRVTANIAQGGAITVGTNCEYVMLADDVADAISRVEVMETQKANVDGVYEALTAGTAMQLIGSSGNTDKAPYLFRRTPFPAARKEVKSIIGATMALNQLAKLDSGAWTLGNVTVAFDASDKVVTVVSDTNSLSLKTAKLKGTIEDHVYLLDAYVKSYEAGTIARFALFNQDNSFAGGIETTSDEYVHLVAIVKKTESTQYIAFRSPNAAPVGSENSYWKPMCIDLTLMLGSDISDHAYTLESGTAGAGIAWLRSYGFFDKDYYAYDAGTLQSVCVSAAKTTGKNLFDVEDISPRKISATSTRNAAYFTIPGTYTVKANRDNAGQYAYLYARKLTSDGEYQPSQYIVVDGIGVSQPAVTFTINSGDTLIVYDANGNTLAVSKQQFSAAQFQVEFGSTATPYEPFESHTYPLDSTVEWRGLYKLVDGAIVADGDEYPASGAGTRKYGYRDYQAGDESLADAITDGTHTVYKLSTPTPVTAAPYAPIPICAGDGTEEFVDALETAGTRDVGVPVGHETFYPTDLVSEIERVMVQVPAPPTTDGTYNLSATISGGVPTFSWVSA